MFSAAWRVLQVSIFGGIVGAVVAGPWAAVAGGALGVAVGGLQEAERRIAN